MVNFFELFMYSVIIIGFVYAIDKFQRYSIKNNEKEAEERKERLEERKLRKKAKKE